MEGAGGGWLSLLVAWVGIREALYFAVIPGVLATAAITVAARQARSAWPGCRGGTGR